MIDDICIAALKGAIKELSKKSKHYKKRIKYLPVAQRNQAKYEQWKLNQIIRYHFLALAILQGKKHSSIEKNCDGILIDRIIGVLKNYTNHFLNIIWTKWDIEEWLKGRTDHLPAYKNYIQIQEDYKLFINKPKINKSDYSNNFRF